MLQCVAAAGNIDVVHGEVALLKVWCVAVCCSVLQCAAVCRVLQCVAVCFGVMQFDAVRIDLSGTCGEVA